MIRLEKTSIKENATFKRSDLRKNFLAEHVSSQTQGILSFIRRNKFTMSIYFHNKPKDIIKKLSLSLIIL